MRYSILTVVMLFFVIVFIPNNSIKAFEGKQGGPSLDNPLGSIEKPEDLIGKIINSLIGVVGSIALAMFIYGGIVWMTAAGNDTRVALGKNVIIWATLGLLVVFSSYALVRFLLNTVGVADKTIREPTLIEIVLS